MEVEFNRVFINQDLLWGAKLPKQERMFLGHHTDFVFKKVVVDYLIYLEHFSPN